MSIGHVGFWFSYMYKSFLWFTQAWTLHACFHFILTVPQISGVWREAMTQSPDFFVICCKNWSSWLGRAVRLKEKRNGKTEKKGKEKKHKKATIHVSEVWNYRIPILPIISIPRGNIKDLMTMKKEKYLAINWTWQLHVTFYSKVPITVYQIYLEIKRLTLVTAMFT